MICYNDNGIFCCKLYNDGGKIMKLRTKILLIALLPVFLLGIGIFFLAADRTANGIYDQAYVGMQATALAVRDIFEIGNEGEYHLDEKGALWKGSTLNISQAIEIVDHIKENTGMDVTIFWGDTRILTSIKNEAGERQIQSRASDAVIQRVLKNGEFYQDRNIEILGTPYIVCYAPFYQEGASDPVGMVFLGTPHAKVSAIIREIRLQMFIVILAVLLVTSLLLTTLVNHVVNALVSGMGLLRAIAGGDLTVEADTSILNRSDEIGMLGKEIMELRSRLLDIISMLRRKSHQLDDESCALKTRTENILLVMGNVEQAAQEMASSCTSQADNASNASNGVSVMGEMIGNSNTQIRQMHEISNEIHDVSEQTAAELSELTRDMETVRRSIDYLEHQTKLTKESVDKIASATDLIAAIASQTRLLSLNASIESARAGELGKGFGVVAAEIQKLSVQSNTAVEDIRGMVESLSDNSSQAMRHMAEVQSVIVSQEQNIKKTGLVFENVKSGVRTSKDHINTVIEKTNVVENIRTDMIAAVQDAAAAAQENAASIEEMMASVETVYDELGSISEKTAELGGLSAELKKSINLFKID